jgi:hypothetical protein
MSEQIPSSIIACFVICPTAIQRCDHIEIYQLRVPATDNRRAGAGAKIT